MLSAQVKVLNLTHYLFPEFSKGSVLMKNGINNEALLNYNSLTEEMIFENKGTKLAVSQVELIDTIFVNGRKFIPVNNKFIEIIYHSKYTLFAEHKCSIKDPGKPSAYGGTSQTSAITTYSSYFSGGQVYELKLPDGYEPKPFVDYWLRKDGKMNKFLSIRQLSKLFSEEEDLFKEYVKKHDVKYDNQASLVEMIRFLEAN
ncbi:MAG TPA: hypothetical protein DCR40_06845 [Prolixibacteraceae bacterium]|nr:hypothetical protein [Prolixibacteraceae bacterium]